MPNANSRGGDWIFLLVSMNSSHVFGYSTLACSSRSSRACTGHGLTASGVKLGRCQNTSFFARCAALLPTRHHGEVVTAAATPADFKTCRRVIPAIAVSFRYGAPVALVDIAPTV